MKFAMALLLSGSVSLSATGQIRQRASDELKPAGGAPVSLEKLVGHRRIGVKPQTIITEGGDTAFLIPAAVNAAGLNGTFFKTDFYISNNGSSAQDVLVDWLAEGASGIGSGGTRFTLDANTVYSIRDFLSGGSLGLNKTGVGSILVTALVTGTGLPDSNASIDGSVRIWTFQPGSSGTTSFAMSAGDVNAVSGALLARAIGLRQDSGFRTNAGIVNLDGRSHTWTVRCVGTSNESSFNVTVPPLSMSQVAIPASVTGDVFLEFTPESGATYSWSAYGVSVDNMTGDAWAVRADQPIVQQTTLDLSESVAAGG